MEKKTFVTKEQLEEIIKHIPPHFIFMTKKEFGKMQKL